MAFEEPYHFVPIVPAAAVTGEPVFHDVQQTGAEFWSGELHCTMTALTPLIAGNYQYQYQFLEDELKKHYRELLVERFHPDNPRDVDETKAKGKKVVEPIRHPSLPGNPVCIPGEAIKGMIRGSLQALLSAPMERVTERTFSFRPNVHDAENIYPAIVHHADYQGGRLRGLTIEAAGAWRDVVYVYPNAEAVLAGHLQADGRLPVPGRLDDLPFVAPRADTNDNVGGLRWQNRQAGGVAIRKIAADQTPNASVDLLGYALARHHDGADGNGTFSRAFDGRTGYSWVLVKLQDEPELRELPERIIANYAATYEHLRDEASGQLMRHPDQVKSRDLNQCRLEAGDMVLVEHAPGARDTIIGLGHHFRHRRRYRDTIHQNNAPNHAQDPPSERLRDQLRPHALEVPRGANGDHAGAPQKLTSARLLFGFVGSKRPKYDLAHPNEPLTFGIGKPQDAKLEDAFDFNQLAGRIAVNWAVEVVEKSGESTVIKDDKTRFLNSDHACFVPLRPLGSPKASAVECYLTQDKIGERTDNGTLCTYGDSPDDPAAGDLRGRKFYLHQPDAKDHPECYELIGDTQNPSDWSYVTSQGGARYHICEGQAMIARFVSKPNTQYRFTIRFRDLRAWELGALLFVLSPDQPMIESLANELNVRDSISRWLGRIPQWQPTMESPLLALKLGHGRPLGLGSVRVEVNSAMRLTFDPNSGMPTAGSPEVAELKATAIGALASFLTSQTNWNTSDWANKVLKPWLQVHRCAGRERFDYEDAPDRHDNPPRTIYNHHTHIRQEHARARKQPLPTQPRDPNDLNRNVLMPLDALDNA